MVCLLYDKSGIHLREILSLLMPLTICNDENIPVVPQGGNTGHCGGAVPNGGVLLNLSRLNKIRNIPIF